MTNKYLPQATQVADIVTHVLTSELRLQPPETFGLAESNGLTWLVVGMNPLALGRNIEAYKSERVTAHLSAALRGMPVVIGNHNGLRYGVLLSRRPALPWLVPFPGIRRGDLRIGQTRRGEASIPWKALNHQGHMMVAGMTGSGKSTLLRSIVLQALADGDICRLSDMDGRTFPMLRGHAQLDMPIATTDADIQAMVEKTLGECELRRRMYDQVGGNPDDVDEYNLAAEKAGKATLPRILLVLDEFSSTITHLGGPKSQFSRNVSELGWRGRKFGIVLIFATQAITKDILGPVRDQIALTVCFKVAPSDTLAAIGVPGADKIPVTDTKHGRAMTNRWGLVQTYLVDKAAFSAPSPVQMLTDRERMLYEAAQRNGGRITRVLISETLGIGVYDGRKIQEELSSLEWIEKNPEEDNAFHVTPRWTLLAANRQTPQTAANRPESSQTDSQTGKPEGIGL